MRLHSVLLCGRFFVLRDKLSRGAGRLPGMPLPTEPRFSHSSTQHRNGGLFMTTINLKDFYYWYTQDQFIEVSDEVAEVFVSDARHEMAYQRRLSRHKAQYSLDCDTGSNIPPACMSQRPRSFWSAWSCSSVCGMHSTLCRRSRAAGLMPTSFLERASRKLPRPRAYMRSLFASRSSVALSV